MARQVSWKNKARKAIRLAEYSEYHLDDV